MMEVFYYFNPLPPHGGRRAAHQEKHEEYTISIHSLRTEGDSAVLRTVLIKANFNPLPPHGGRQVRREENPITRLISIHSLRTEGDAERSAEKLKEAISIHSLRTEGDFPQFEQSLSRPAFQSTPSARRETKVDIFEIVGAVISIHSLRTEGDEKRRRIMQNKFLFQSTPSARRETSQIFYVSTHIAISIHSLRTEGDRLPSARRLPDNYFNPLPPHGGRQTMRVWRIILRVFQSTPSARRETRA